VTVNKADLVDRVVDKAGSTRQQVESVLDAFFETVRSTAKSGDRVGWPGFGSFSTTQRKARTGRNPRTGEAVKIPATKAVKFSPSSTLKDFMNSGAAKKAAAKKAGGSKKAAAKKAAPAKKASAAKATKKSGATKAPAKKAAKARKR
jgi:DNA-binding protein HU-beta